MRPPVRRLCVGVVLAAIATAAVAPALASSPQPPSPAFYVGKAKGKSSSVVGAYISNGKVEHMFFSGTARCYRYGELTSKNEFATVLPPKRIKADDTFSQDVDIEYGEGKYHLVNHMEGRIRPNRSRARPSSASTRAFQGAT